MDTTTQTDRHLMIAEVLKGLKRSQKELPSKYFYDERGSQLFEEITRLDEYYLTNAEKRILQTNIQEIGEAVGPRAVLVELGSGSSNKTRLLLNHLSDMRAYIPVDISEEFLLKVVSRLRVEYPKVSIIPVFADYTASFDLPGMGDNYNKQVVFFPGSTIGNYHPGEVVSFLQNIAASTDNADMLVGVDLKKDPRVLEAAYNDKEGITADFNKNILVRLNQELNANFDVDCFSHRAFYNEDKGRIEMHLISRNNQVVNIAGEGIRFEEGEAVHTENSYKYSLQEFEELVGDSYSVQKVWTDKRNYFSVQYLQKK